MKQITTIITLLLMLPLITEAQEYKIAKSTGRLELNLGRVTVEGYDGNEIIFSARNQKSEKDERAEGLRRVNSLGLQDNTGLGIHVADKGNVIEVHQLKTTHAPDVTVRVPKGIIVSFKHDSQYGGTAKFINLSNEIEVSALYNSVVLEQVTGPLTIETTYGGVTADFKAPIEDPVSIVSIYGFVDVTLPQSTQADLNLSTSYGDIFVAAELDIQVTPTEGMQVFSNKVAGTINGGGADISLNCNYGKIYLRKK
jgi:hypothetical protein